AHGLFGELGVGTVTASTLQLGLGVAGLLAGLGLTFIATGAGLVWAAARKSESGIQESESSSRDLASV
uniref:hypothetical protein n=1 Tax=Euzebya sp. TaxID=1971409 RepID=UPI003514F061